EVLLRRADALALGGRLSEAFEIYQKASKLKRLRPAQLENLTECLLGSIRSKEGLGAHENQEHDTTSSSVYGAFTCRICLGFLYEPVTLPCGHTYCRKCLDREKERPLVCKQCKDSTKLCDVHDYRMNVVLCNLLAKWFPSQVQAVRLRHEGNALYAEKNLEAALEKYDEAIQLAPRDHLLFSNRSQINSSLKNCEAALSDAEMACRLQPLWLKGHLRKAQALTILRKSEEALTEYLFCIALEPESKMAKCEAQKVHGSIGINAEFVSLKQIYCIPVSTARPQTYSAEGQRRSGSFTAEPQAPYQPQGLLMRVESQSSFSVADAPGAKPPCCEDQGKVKYFSQEYQPPAFDTSCLLKRKLGMEEEDKGGSFERSCKNMKQDTTSTVPKAATATWCSVPSDLIDPCDLECSLCMRLFYEPVTTPCGHTFCLKCLERCLDHNSQCPLCKERLSEYLAQRKYSKTPLLEGLIDNYLLEELVERRKVHEEEIAELSNLNKNVPIFVCTMAFPTVPCPLHIFEPCYRLMIRRCMETGTKQFGMCITDSIKGFADYGCILEIRNVEFFADGRSVVDTVGKRRFRVIEQHQCDGYNTADIEYLEDKKVEGEGYAALLSLHDAVYNQSFTWFNSLKPEQKERITGHFGPMPDKEPEPQVSPSGPSWCWWLLAVLPLEGRAQLLFLAMTSLRERLVGIRRVLSFM
ncbi:LONF3 protein, partial [Polyodon spathula]|nr:LONF3 protein [Polyodon spathula]